jgi:hypothetical protein
MPVVNAKEWKDAVIGSIFEDTIKDRKIKRNIFKTRQGKMPVIFDVKVDSEGNGFTCSDPEHAGIMSSLALLSDHLRKFEDSMSIVCASVREYHDVAKPDHAVDPVEITKVLENAIMEGVARAMKPVKRGELKKKGKS